MIKKFDVKANSLLSDAIDQIEAVVVCPRFLWHGQIIDIDVWENVQDWMTDVKEVAEAGFGFCIPNYSIIINMDNCKKADFTEREFAALICHELGHILNHPELIREPTILDYGAFGGDEYNRNVAQIRKLNALRNEVFADSYACQHGYKTELISTFHKQNRHFEQKIGLMDERVEAINSEELFEGVFAPIRRE